MLSSRVVSVPIYFVIISIAPKMYIDAANVVPKYTLCHPVVHVMWYGHVIQSRGSVELQYLGKIGFRQSHQKMDQDFLRSYNNFHRR